MRSMSWGFTRCAGVPDGHLYCPLVPETFLPHKTVDKSLPKSCNFFLAMSSLCCVVLYCVSVSSARIGDQEECTRGDMAQ